MQPVVQFDLTENEIRAWSVPTAADKPLWDRDVQFYQL